VQCLVDGLTTLMTWWLAKQLGGRVAGRSAALLYALNPSQVRYAAELLSETLLSALLALAACAFVRYLLTGHRPVWLALSAASSALAVLCKPNALCVPLIWLLAAAVVHRHHWKRGLAHALMTALITALVLVPWIARNAAVFGRPLLSTAFQGNISRVSAPTTLAHSRGQSVAPWSTEWEALFGEIVSATAARFGWTKPWDTLTARELDVLNHQVFLTSRKVLLQHPLDWVSSHTLGLARYLEPQTYRACYARFSGKKWPPDVLNDAVIHVVRSIRAGEWTEAGQIIASERWGRLDGLQRIIWWGTLAGQLVGIVLLLRGVWNLRRQPVLVAALLLAIGYMLWLPGPIAYERFLVPVSSLLLSLIGVSLSARQGRSAGAFAVGALGTATVRP
jgi:4-amino-4-deoxy-L-arabinose transferase-like glycosyltransferase